MSDLTERACEAVYGTATMTTRDDVLASAVINVLDRAGMLADPDAEDFRIAAAWELVQEWDRQAWRALERASALLDHDVIIRRHVALQLEARTASDYAAQLRRVLED